MAEEITFKKAFDTALALHQGGDLNTAEIIYNELLNYIPDHIDILHLKGVLANQKKEFKSAIELITKSLDLIPNESKAHPAFSIFHQNLANAYFQDGQFEKAEECYKKSLELNAQNVDTKYNYARLLTKEKRYDEAIKELDELLTITPTYINAKLQKAEIYFKLAQYEKAKELLEIKLEVDSHDLDARMLLGKSLLELGEFQLALENFEKASKLGTNLYEPYFYMGVASENLGNPDKAKEYFQTALYINPSHEDTKIKLAILNQ